MKRGKMKTRGKIQNGVGATAVSIVYYKQGLNEILIDEIME